MNHMFVNVLVLFSVGRDSWLMHSKAFARLDVLALPLLLWIVEHAARPWETAIVAFVRASPTNC